MTVVSRVSGGSSGKRVAIMYYCSKVRFRDSWHFSLSVSIEFCQAPMQLKGVTTRGF